MNSGVLRYGEAATQIAMYAARLAASRERRQLPMERVELSYACGRVLAEPLFADRDLPPFARSTRDGFACCAEDVCSYEPLTIAGATRAGEAPGGPLPAGEAWEIMTGAPVPTGADAVVMVEHVEIAEGRVQMLPPHTIAAGENIVPQGAEARRGEELLAAGSVVGFGQIALAANCGYSALQVFERPRVAILATGDELVPVEFAPGPGQIRNSNGPMLAAMVAAAGGESWILPVAADDDSSLDRAIEPALDADLLLITGGVSAGKFDLVEPALARFGASFHFTGVLIQPGKPTVFGELQRTSGETRRETGCDTGMAAQPLPFLGLPGNPVSSAVTFLLFAAPVLAALCGKRRFGRDFGAGFALALLASEVRHKPGLTRFLPASCSFRAAGSQLPEVALVPWQGSGDVASMARSNCFLVVPEEVDRLEAGSTVCVLLNGGIA